MSNPTLREIWFYPVKSLRGIRLERAELDGRGIRYDRHWMLVDGNGEFLSQRKEPRMALIDQRLQGEMLVLDAPGMDSLQVPLAEGEGEALAVQVWRDRCHARGVGAEADAWFGRFLGRECRMVYLPSASCRPVDPNYAGPLDQTGFSDGFPLLTLSTASLADLNGRLEAPLPIQRFRPNLVIDGCAPYAEDCWREMRIGGLGFRLVKPCSRCVITTIDPANAERGVEPLRTLNGYRREGNKVFFGQNTLHDGPGELRVGMAVEIISEGEPRVRFDTENSEIGREGRQ